jgi:CPA1 family monovalent cation:H+ antiporter
MIPWANITPAEGGSALLVAELVIIAAVALVVKWIRLPYTIALVTAGLGVGLLRAQHFIDINIALTPELVFTIFLPVLLFEAAFNLNYHHLRENAKPIALFAVPGVILASLGVGYGLHLGLGMPLAPALVFGALISATDPISVLALFKQLKAPSRLSTIVEGESLFNDGAAVVVFKILLVLALTGKFSLAVGILQFLAVSLGGLLCGILLGFAVSKITALVDDHLIEITLSTILAYGSFIAAEHFGASGVMSVIAAGLVYGNYGKSVGMSPNTQVMMGAFWEYAGFLMNSLVFLLIGTQVDLRLLATKWQPILLAFVCVILARALVVAILAPLCGWLDKPISLKWRGVLAWAGLRGSISMALAIGLPLDLPWRNEILLMTFGVVILSLYLQGLTMPWLLRTWKVVEPIPEEVLAYENKLAHLLMHQRGLEQLHVLRSSHTIGTDVHDELSGPYQKSIALLHTELAELARQHGNIRQEQIRDAHKVMTTAQMAALRQAYEQGLISTEVKDRLLVELAESQIREGDEAAGVLEPAPQSDETLETPSEDTP